MKGIVTHHSLGGSGRSISRGWGVHTLDGIFFNFLRFYDKEVYKTPLNFAIHIENFKTPCSKNFRVHLGIWWGVLGVKTLAPTEIFFNLLGFFEKKYEETPKFWHTCKNNQNTPLPRTVFREGFLGSKPQPFLNFFFNLLGFFKKNIQQPPPIFPSASDHSDFLFQISKCLTSSVLDFFVSIQILIFQEVSKVIPLVIFTTKAQMRNQKFKLQE